MVRWGANRPARSSTKILAPSLNGPRLGPSGARPVEFTVTFRIPARKLLPTWRKNPRHRVSSWGRRRRGCAGLEAKPSGAIANDAGPPGVPKCVTVSSKQMTSLCGDGPRRIRLRDEGRHATGLLNAPPHPIYKQFVAAGARLGQTPDQTTYFPTFGKENNVTSFAKYTCKRGARKWPSSVTPGSRLRISISQAS
jgi:hypothetical protein